MNTDKAPRRPSLQRRAFLRSSLGLGAAILAAQPDGGSLQWRSRTLIGFGTTLRLRAAHARAEQADTALDAAVRTLRGIEAQMSLFDPASAVSRLNRDGRLDDPPPELLDVLRRAREVSARSDGAFDVTVQPLWQCFAAAAAEGRLPAPDEAQHARALVDWRGLEIGATRLRLRRPGMGVTLNGIAQGHAADRVQAVLAAHGIRHALIDVGEWASLGDGPDGRRWRLGLADPRQEGQLLARIALDGRAVATSADDRTCFSADRRHHHIFDPHTGWSPTGLASATVLAASGALADALTKVMFVAGPAGGLAAARDWGVDVLLVGKDGRLHMSPGVRALLG